MEKIYCLEPADEVEDSEELMALASALKVERIGKEAVPASPAKRPERKTKKASDVTLQRHQRAFERNRWHEGEREGVAPSVIATAASQIRTKRLQAIKQEELDQRMQVWDMTPFH